MAYPVFPFKASLNVATAFTTFTSYSPMLTVSFFSRLLATQKDVPVIRANMFYKEPLVGETQRCVPSTLETHPLNMDGANKDWFRLLHKVCKRREFTT